MAGQRERCSAHHRQHSADQDPDEQARPEIGLQGLVAALARSGSGRHRHGGAVDPAGGMGGSILHCLFYPPDSGLVHLRLPAVLEAGPFGLSHGGDDLCGVCGA